MSLVKYIIRIQIARIENFEALWLPMHLVWREAFFHLPPLSAAIWSAHFCSAARFSGA